MRVPVRTRRPSLPNRPVLAVRRLTSRAPARSDSLFRSTSHCISIHDAVSAEPWDVPGALRAFSCGGTPADCAMLGLRVLYPGVRFDLVISGINRGDNLGLHVVYSGTVAGAREGAMRVDAVGIAVSLCSYSRSADYAAAAECAAELAAEIADAPALARALRGRVLTVNVPAVPRRDIRGIKLTRPGVSCTQCDWVRVAGEVARDVTDADADFPDGASELPIPADGALDEDAKWVKGKRWFRNKPGPARDDRREGFDKRAVDDGFISVSVLGVGFDATFPAGISSAVGVTAAKDARGIVRALEDASCAAGAGA